MRSSALRSLIAAAGSLRPAGPCAGARLHPPINASPSAGGARARSLEPGQPVTHADRRDPQAGSRTRPPRRTGATSRGRRERRAPGAASRCGRKLEALETQRTEGLPALREQFVDLYKRGRRGELALLLSANGLREFARASRAAAALAFRRQRVVGDHERTLADLRAEREALTIKGRELRAQETRAETARRGAERAVAARAALARRHRHPPRPHGAVPRRAAAGLRSPERRHDRARVGPHGRAGVDSGRAVSRRARVAGAPAGWPAGSVSRAPPRAPCATASRWRSAHQHAGPRRARRHGGLRRGIHRAGHAGHPEPRREHLLALRLSGRGARQKGRPRAGRRGGGQGRAGAGRGPADALFRAPRRRPFGRSRRMVEAPLTRHQGPEDSPA